MKLYARHYKPASSDELQGDNPIVIIHGLFGSHRNWHPVADVLAKQFPVYSLDLRNHGQSPHDDDMSYPAMAQDVAEFINQEGLQSANLIAHSMGGKVAMWLALTQPELIHKLVIVDIAPVSYEHDFAEVLAAFDAVPLAQLSTRREADEWMAQHLQQFELRQFLLQNLQRRDGRFHWRLNLNTIKQTMQAITSFPDTRELKSFDKRVLFVGGGQSDYLSRERQQQTRQLFPMASFSMIKNAGHWLHAEQPELFLALIEHYL
jgi:pimeloyl-ACP methyl ester carboxylesterase